MREGAPWQWAVRVVDDGRGRGPGPVSGTALRRAGPGRRELVRLARSGWWWGAVRVCGLFSCGEGSSGDMGERLSVVFEADPGADERLAGEALAAAGVRGVEPGGPAGCASLGAVVVRRGGELVGWATLLEPDGRDGEPHVQWALASLEVELVAGAAGGGAVGEEAGAGAGGGGCGVEVGPGGGG